MFSGFCRKLTIRFWLLPVFGAVLGIAGLALAYGYDVGNLRYTFYQDENNPTYLIARDAMKPTYKDAPWDVLPLIGIAEIDLNGDGYAEIISFPTEDEAQEG